ncbi:MAG: hypothetical protein FWB86_00980 [Treponema sp.]|nr:hypothetical protein [Treponema sp.]MCL2250672.1 hypothetical protein [Treponema sp.]
MLASQYIYTACGKDRNGAFSVFSKSKDVTEEESAEIREVMIYKTPPGLPYEPTAQEIEDLFPKKYGYFILSSGRVCLAQVCYVGRVYSELDTRWGNYIIHAFVFDKTGDFSPYSFIENNIFKRELTKQEWHDDPIPDDLKKVNIPDNGGMLSQNDLTSFLNDDRKEKLKLFLEAIIQSSSEKSISFNDDHKKLKYWLKIISLCLPKEMQNKISICSYFINGIVPGNVSSKIQIRFNRTESSQFTYVQEAQRGGFAFDLIKNIIPSSVSPGKYTESVVNLLATGIFEAVKFVDDINKIMSVYSVNINEAADLFNIKKADFSAFKDAKEIFDTVLLADNKGYETHSIAANLCNNMTKINFDAQQKLSIYSFIYKNIKEIKTRVGIIKIILNSAEKFGISTSGAVAFRDDLKSKANFIFENYLDYLKEEGLSNYIGQNQNSFIKLFLVYDTLINLPAVKNSIQTKNYTAEESNVSKNIFASVLKQKSVSDLDLLIKCSESLGLELLSFIVSDEMKSGNKFTDTQFAFNLLLRLRTKKDFAYSFLIFLINNNSGKDEFIKLYIDTQNKDNAFFIGFEGAKNQELKDFLIKKDAYSFMNEPLSLKALKDYFEKYYIKGADTGIFSKRLSEYLRGIQTEKKIKECFNILETMKFPANTDKALLMPVYISVLETIFSLPYEIIFKDDLLKKQDKFNLLNELYNTANNAIKQETRELYLITVCGRILEDYGFKQKVMDVISFFSKSNEKNHHEVFEKSFKNVDYNKSINTFVEFYFQPVVNILISGATADAKQFNYDDIVKKAFGKIIEKANTEEITFNIIEGIKKTRTDSAKLIMYLFKKHLLNSKEIIDKKLGEIAENYFEKVSKGDRKKIFDKLMSLAEEKEQAQFKKYFEDFNNKHKSSILDIFKKK